MHDMLLVLTSSLYVGYPVFRVLINLAPLDLQTPTAFENRKNYIGHEFYITL
jgi:hypothetical protein